MNKTDQQIEAALKRLDADPALAAEFENLRRTEYPGKTRREAAALGLAAIQARTEAALAAQRALAMKNTASLAARTFKKALATVATITKRPDKRQAPLQISDWHTQHVMQAAEKGDQVAIAEIQRRGFEITGTTFSKKA